jgi:hypothetical protein
MLEKQERLAVLILVAVLAVCAISAFVLETLGKEPFARQYDPGLPDGTLVAWEGIVQKIIRVSQGSSLIMDVSGVQVYVPSPVAPGLPEENDRITLYGVIQTWKGKREILVTDGKDIRIVAESQGKNLHS